MAEAGIPAVLERVYTDADLLEIKAKQRAQRERALADSRLAVRFTPEQTALVHALRSEETALEEIRRLENDLVITIWPLYRAGEPGRILKLQAIRRETRRELAAQRRQLARALRDQGRLDEATAADPDYAGNLDRGRAAIARADNETCECEDTRFSRHTLRKTTRDADGTKRYWVECSCGHLNARCDLPPRLAAEIAVSEAAGSEIPDEAFVALVEKYLRGQVA